MVGRADGERRLTGTSATAQYRHSAKALMTSGDAVLLVKEYHSDGTPFWTLPGGGVRPDESLTEGLRRELREELDCHNVVIGEQTGRVWYAHRSRVGAVSLSSFSSVKRSRNRRRRNSRASPQFGGCGLRHFHPRRYTTSASRISGSVSLAVRPPPTGNYRVTHRISHLLTP
jgi:hypothetical protein